MGHTNSTTHYNLPQFLTTDKPAWLVDINGAFADIDTAINTAQSDATTAGNNATQAISDASAAATAASAADAKGAGAVASIEAAFDSTAVYAVGAKVMYNSLLYRCNVAVTTPGPWTGSANWERITVDSLIPEEASDLPLGLAPYTTGSTGEAIDVLANYKAGVISENASAIHSWAFPSNQAVSWTATDNCMICGTLLSGASNSAYVNIGSITAGYAFSGGSFSVGTGLCIPVMRGQIVTVGRGDTGSNVYAMPFK